MPALIIATGAFDCGKTTTLEWLREHHGLRIHTEAHRMVLRRIAGRSGGHPPERGFTRIEDPAHFCPMCRPLEFCQLVLAEQRAIELRAREGDLLERGYLDPLEMFDRTRRPEQRAPGWTPVARYRLVLLFEVMEQLQRARWGKSVATRIAEAKMINERLTQHYLDAGFPLLRVPPGSVAERGAQVLAEIARAQP